MLMYCYVQPEYFGPTKITLLRSSGALIYSLIVTYAEHETTGCPKSPLTTLNLNNLKIKSRIAKQNTYLKTKGLHNFFDTKYDVLLEIYKLNKFSGPIPKISCFIYSHVLTDGSMLHH